MELKSVAGPLAMIWFKLKARPLLRAKHLWVQAGLVVCLSGEMPVV